MVPPAICQGKRQSAVLEWLSKLGYRKTTIATRMPNIRTTIANRLMWFPSQDSCGGAEFARKSGTNSSGVGAAESAAESDEAPCSRSRCFSLSFFSQSRQCVLPPETGNPQEAHFCTRSMASGTAAGAGDEITGDSAGRTVGSANSGLREMLRVMLTGIAGASGALLAVESSGESPGKSPGERSGESSGETSARFSGS